MTDRSDAQARFWQLAQPFLAMPGVSRSTMMGFPCLRLQGDFFASWDARAERLVVKLDSGDVETLTHTGQGLPCAPAGRRFREWVAISARNLARWPILLENACMPGPSRANRWADASS